MRDGVKEAKIMWAYFPPILATLITITALGSCAKPAATDADGITQHNSYLKDMGDGVCKQFPAGLMWQIKRSKRISSWQEADAYANNLQLGGFDDWRLPTRDECYTLSQLLSTKKGDCPIKIKTGHWVSDNTKKKPGFWEDYQL